MDRTYYKSKWRFEDLQDKKIQFTLSAQGFWVEGIGILLVHLNGEQISIDIEGSDNIFRLFKPSLADKIEPHPDKSVADFRLMA